MRRSKQPLTWITTVRFSEADHAALQRLADEADVSVGELIRTTISTHLLNQGSADATS